MSDINKLARAKTVFDTICATLDANDWHYDKDKEKLIFNFGISGDDLPIKILIIVDAERQLVRLLSPIGFNMSEEKRMEGAIAVCAATYGMADGSFEYDISDGQIIFKMTASFRESILGKELFNYMIGCTCAMVDKYNDKFLALDKGFISITEFMEKA